MSSKTIRLTGPNWRRRFPSLARNWSGFRTGRAGTCCGAATRPSGPEERPCFSPWSAVQRMIVFASREGLQTAEARLRPTSRFSVVERRENGCTLRLSSGPATLTSYPFSFQLDVTYEIAGSVLINRVVVTNEGEQALPVSFGFHPAFAGLCLMERNGSTRNHLREGREQPADSAGSGRAHDPDPPSISGCREPAYPRR